MKRFADIVTEVRPLMEKRSGLDGFPGDKCALCGVVFDVGDAKVWTLETGKAHFKCYVEHKKEVPN